MSTAEIELNDKFAGFGDRELFVPPQRDEDIKLSRFLFTAADLIPPDVKRERPHMKRGGLNVYNVCLTHVRDFIQRGRIVPLLINQHMPVTVEEKPENDTSWFEVVETPEIGRPANLESQFRASGMVSKLAYPGQQIVHILEGPANIDASGRRIGIVEIGTLKGHEYKLVRVEEGYKADRELLKIQQAVFPDYPNLPRTLRPFTQQVLTAIDSNRGDIRSIAEEMYPSCTQYEAWALRWVDIVHQSMDQAATKGYAAPYEPIDLLVLDQLEMARQDGHFQRQAQIAASQPAPAPALDKEGLAAIMRENREMFVEAMQMVKQEWELDRQTRPDETVKAPAVEVAPVVETKVAEKPKGR